MDKGFVAVPDSHGHLDFDLQTRWTPRIRKAFLASGADGLIANYARGFVGHDLEFLRDLPLRRLNVLARTIRDLAPIHDLGETLEELHVQAGAKTRLDLASLPHLRALSCDWQQVTDSIGNAASIDDLYLGSYDPANLAPIAHLTELRSLRIKDRPALRSLDGIEAMPWLAHLGIYLSPLEDISALALMSSPVLTELHLQSCRRIGSLSDLQGLTGLEFLNVSECGDIESLAPIAGLRRLEGLYLYGSTKIVNGDLSPLLGMTRMRDLRLVNRQHYAPSVNDVKSRSGLSE